MVEYVAPGEEHVLEIYRLEKRCFDEPWSLAVIFEDVVVNKNPYFTAWEDGEILGYCALRLVADEAHITNICVASEHRGRGIAKKLLALMTDCAKNKGAVGMTLEVRESNAPAISLYASHAFTVEGVRKDYYTNPRENALIMWKHGI